MLAFFLRMHNRNRELLFQPLCSETVERSLVVTDSAGQN